MTRNRLAKKENWLFSELMDEQKLAVVVRVWVMSDGLYHMCPLEDTMPLLLPYDLWVCQMCLSLTNVHSYSYTASHDWHDKSEGESAILSRLLFYKHTTTAAASASFFLAQSHRSHIWLHTHRLTYHKMYVAQKGGCDPMMWLKAVKSSVISLPHSRLSRRSHHACMGA